VQPEISGNAPHTLSRIHVNNLLVRIALLGGVPVDIYELHLLQHRRLARLAGTEEQHLDLVLGHHPVPLELLFDLVVAYAVIALSDLLATGEKRQSRAFASSSTIVLLRHPMLLALQGKVFRVSSRVCMPLEEEEENDDEDGVDDEMGKREKRRRQRNPYVNCLRQSKVCQHLTLRMLDYEPRSKPVPSAMEATGGLTKTLPVLIRKTASSNRQSAANFNTKIQPTVDKHQDGSSRVLSHFLRWSVFNYSRQPEPDNHIPA
jgi:hypothetical protein